MSIPWSKDKLMVINMKLMEENKRYKNAIEEIRLQAMMSESSDDV